MISARQQCALTLAKRGRCVFLSVTACGLTGYHPGPFRPFGGNGMDWDWVYHHQPRPDHRFRLLDHLGLVLHKVGRKEGSCGLPQRQQLPSDGAPNTFNRSSVCLRPKFDTLRCAEKATKRRKTEERLLIFERNLIISLYTPLFLSLSFWQSMKGFFCVGSAISRH